MTTSLPKHAELDKATSQANENSEQTSPAAATAPRITITEDGPYVVSGSVPLLLDDNRCAYARFCHREDGDAWSLTERSGDERLRHEAVKASSDCPSGRLVHYDAQSGAEQEP